MVRKEILALVVMVLALLLPTLVQAGILSLYEIGMGDVGLAGERRVGGTCACCRNDGHIRRRVSPKAGHF